MKLQPVLRHLSLGSVAACENLTFAPISGPDAIATDFLLPDEALHTGYFIVQESGEVETLRVENRLGVPVFVPAGATFEGETQNRAARFAVIVAPRSGDVPLLVRCIEQGQPLVAAKRFSASGNILLPAARTGDVDQNSIWGTISGTIRMRDNPTLDYSLGLHSVDTTGYREAMGPAIPGQRGYVAAVRDRDRLCFYADVMGSEKLYARLHDKLCAGLAATAAAGRGRRTAQPAAKNELLTFLREAGEQEIESRTLSTGFLGAVCVGAGSVEISALVHSDVPVQVSFRKEPPQPRRILADATIFPSALPR